MGAKTVVVVGAAGVTAALVAKSLGRNKREAGTAARHPAGWKSVTIMGDAGAFATDGYPEPLNRIATALEIRVEPAPGDKGFEVHARVRDHADGAGAIENEPSDHELRVALRDAKQLFETGEILRPTPRPHGRRPPTLTGKAVDAAEADAKGSGVL